MSALGMPENYPAIEEYDVVPEPPLVKQDGSWTEEAEQLAPGELPAGPDGEDAPDIESHEKENTMRDYNMKDVHRSVTGQVSDQNRGGLPCPEQKEKEMAKTETRTSSVFYVKGLRDGKPFKSGKYRFVEKAQNGARGAVAAGLEEVRVVRLSA